MALIDCPECKKQVSDKADKCINCGFPLDKFINLKCQEGDCANEAKLVANDNRDISAYAYKKNENTGSFRKNNSDYTIEFFDLIIGSALGGLLFYMTFFVYGQLSPAKHFVQLVLLASIGAYVRYTFKRNQAIFPAIIGSILGILIPIVYIFSR